MYVIFLKPYLGTRKKLKIELEKQITPTSFKNNLHRLFLKWCSFLDQKKKKIKKILHKGFYALIVIWNNMKLVIWS